ncbi:hypothetical protein [Flagellimonas allohymeniacidonis]|uniref:Sulfotransferase family protein n=1 Tax=Flagellimonas allohymeniacidonis TaxID=2517819 RepID=A0A4Q8QDM5_9FLAO|nr:hypothetical protein [Allomuricauda hymeniacidonis]TAI48582.1 hypothetical protein EW142_01910 [Allomuricauda hymeniacidonis]
MAGYSATDKFLHKLYLSKYGISKATMEMDEMVYGQRAKALPIDQVVFVTGLARSGTTAVMNKIFKSGEYASLQYANMPFLLSPNLWNRKSNIKAHERAHKDGIIIDGNSPEEFDEYFWKAFLKDSFIEEDGLSIHDVDDEIFKKYLLYVSLICLAKGKNKYISKNNNNVLRLSALQRIENQKTFILFRDPLSHASSLMKLHKSFSKNQTEDPFALDYFNYLGHHEFGLNHKPFLLTEEFTSHRGEFDMESIDYWLAIWLNYYRYVLKTPLKDTWFIGFEDLIKEPDVVYEHIAREIGFETTFPPSKKHTPSTYTKPDCNKLLLDECQNVYTQLSELRSYQI